MNNLKPTKQTKLYGLNKYLLELIRLYKSNIYPNKILLSGLKGIGKSTLAYHFINYVLTENEHFKYDLKNLEINSESKVFKTITNRNISFISHGELLMLSILKCLFRKIAEILFNNPRLFSV